MSDIMPAAKEFMPSVPPAEGPGPAESVRSNTTVLPTNPAQESPEPGHEQTYGMKMRSGFAGKEQTVTPPEPRPITGMTPRTPEQHWWDRVRKFKRH